MHVAGLGYSSPTPFNTPGEYSEEEMAARLAKFADLKPLVLICHAPPLNTALDRVNEGLHAGSRKPCASSSSSTSQYTSSADTFTRPKEW